MRLPVCLSVRLPQPPFLRSRVSIDRCLRSHLAVLLALLILFVCCCCCSPRPLGPLASRLVSLPTSPAFSRIWSPAFLPASLISCAFSFAYEREEVKLKRDYH
ncbi:hypothetical protein BKA80DRAFT_264363 [Phyllosticta citrichinensis]